MGYWVEKDDVRLPLVDADGQESEEQWSTGDQPITEESIGRDISYNPTASGLVLCRYEPDYHVQAVAKTSAGIARLLAAAGAARPFTKLGVMYTWDARRAVKYCRAVDFDLEPT